ncbi:MAG: SRPBCC domain-containing protein [Gammaproteobacteria bacterium]|nr:SRPBCC domain-containing protein [Gammaproteobacteria bacterium]
MADIIHRIGVAAPAADIYKVLTTNEGLSRWWTTDTSGAGDAGSVIEFRFNGDGPDFEVAELQTDTLVKWKHYGKMPTAWMGTEVIFELKSSNEQTYLSFTHANWKEPSDFMAHCSTKWAVFLLSLKDAIETGAGRPFPNDIHIDHDE